MNDDDEVNDMDDVLLAQALDRWAGRNPPPEPPVEEMWEEIRARLPGVDASVAPVPIAMASAGASSGVSATTSSTTGRARALRFLRMGGALAAALVAGVVLGRWTAPEQTSVLMPGMQAMAPEPEGAARTTSTPAPATGQVAETGSPLEGARDGEPDPGALVPAQGARPELAGGVPAGRDPSPGVLATLDPGAGDSAAEPQPFTPPPAMRSAMRFATSLHLREVGPLLTRVLGGADPVAGSVPPEVSSWAERLLAETRDLIYLGEHLDPDLVGLLLDLEVILAQVVMIPSDRPEAVRMEIDLITEGMADLRILPRIRTMAMHTDMEESR